MVFFPCTFFCSLFGRTFGFDEHDVMIIKDFSIATMQANSWRECAKRRDNQIVETYETVMKAVLDKNKLVSFTCGQQTVKLKRCGFVETDSF